jgi:hypothetical protein
MSSIENQLGSTFLRCIAASIKQKQYGIVSAYKTASRFLVEFNAQTVKNILNILYKLSHIIAVA